MSKLKKIMIPIFIFLCSFILMLSFTGFEKEAFLYDDNRTQWYPIIEKVYEQLFNDGTLPSYSFYLAKGLPIAEPGYYGILNPFMALSFFLAHALPWSLNSITIYICLMTSLGCVFLYGVCDQLGIEKKVSLIAIAAMHSCGTFVAFFYWYYVFNNILFIPMLIYAFLKFRGTKAEYFACGLILALDIFCGNVQYTFYHYMIYCIMAFVMIILKKKNSFKAAVSNVMIGIILSLPVFIMLINASSDFGGDDFLAQTIHFSDFILNMIFPMGILKSAGINIPTPDVVIMGRYDKFILYTASCMVPVIICSIPYFMALVKNIKSVGMDVYIKSLPAKLKEFFKDERKVMILGIFVSFLVFMNICDESLIAEILSKVPVINHFRYLFKALFVIVPLLVVLTAVLLNVSKGKWRKTAMLTCSVFVMIGIVNNFFVYKNTKAYYNVAEQKTVAEEAEQLEKMVSQNGLDLKNYRSICLYCNACLLESMFDYSKNITRNFPAYMGYFTLSAYEMSLREDVISHFDMIFDPEENTTKYANGGTIGYLYENLELDPQGTEEQLIKNGIKYIIVQRETQVTEWDEEWKEENKPIYEKFIKYQYYTDKLAESLDTLDRISVEEVRRLDDEYDLIILSGAESICTNDSGDTVSFNDDNMDQLSFVPDGSDSYTMQLAYNEKLFAEYIDDSGDKKPLNLIADENGNTVISAEKQSGGRIVIGYSNKVFNAGIVCEITISALIIILFAAACVIKKDSALQK